MSSPPPPPVDIPPPPEAERLADLQARRAELEQKLADEKTKLRRLQADRRALLRKQIKQAKARLSTAERKRRNQRLIQMGLLLEARTQADPEEYTRMLEDLDDRLTRTDLRALFGLPLLDKPSKPSTPPAGPGAPTGSRDDPLTGWHPYKIPGTNQWGAEFEGATTALPDELVDRYILVTARRKRGKSWAAPVSEVLERTDRLVRVRTKRE